MKTLIINTIRRRVNSKAIIVSLSNSALSYFEIRFNFSRVFVLFINTHCAGL